MIWCWLPSTLEIKFNGKKGVVNLGCVVFEDGFRSWDRCVKLLGAAMTYCSKHTAVCYVFYFKCPQPKIFNPFRNSGRGVRVHLTLESKLSANRPLPSDLGIRKQPRKGSLWKAQDIGHQTSGQLILAHDIEPLGSSDASCSESRACREIAL